MPATLPYAFNLTLDTAGELEIERLYARLLGLGVAEPDLVTQYGPCITLLVLADRVQPKVVSTLLEWKLPAMEAMPVRFTGPCVIHGMPPTLGLRVEASEALLSLHHMIYNELPEEEVHFHYRPAYWQPHLKLSNVRDEGEANRLADAMAGTGQCSGAMADRLEVMQYPPVQSIWQATLRTKPSHKA